MFAFVPTSGNSAVSISGRLWCSKREEYARLGSRPNGLFMSIDRFRDIFIGRPDQNSDRDASHIQGGMGTTISLQFEPIISLRAVNRAFWLFKETIKFSTRAPMHSHSSPTILIQTLVIPLHDSTRFLLNNPPAICEIVVQRTLTHAAPSQLLVHVLQVPRIL